MAFKLEELLKDSPDQNWVESAGTQRYLANQEVVVPVVLEGKQYAPLEYAHLGGFSRTGVEAAWFRELQETLRENGFELSDKFNPPAQNDASWGNYPIVDRKDDKTFYMTLSTSRRGKRFYIENGVLKSYNSGITIDFNESGGKTIKTSDLKKE
ncbi:MAG TPA: hypothetical protein HA282_01315 [Nanoarchaeota archaeon]|nr:MAG: hypothetical protein QT01_C0003G0005 [archaeon GW2011_AR6]HIH18317.1 hypothetical protein [Nanoarchaeota archaeon]HIH33859.1 hypothetical protein [Nanoarchaeota archaeon]HIH65838.1 hypothetical protein [Nanoarchaeota archaeon]